MSEQIKQAKETFKMLCEHIIHDLNRYNKSDIDKDYFYNPKYECGFVTGGKTLYTADILKALEEAEQIAKELKDLRDFMAIILSKSYWSNRFGWIKECKTCEEYNSIFVEKTPNRLTQNEFDLVKKVVEKYGR